MFCKGSSLPLFCVQSCTRRRTHQKNTYNLLIEAQGQQHITPKELFGGEEQFKIQQEHDKRKRDYAEANGYSLLEIWYYDYDRIEEILNKELEVV